LFTFVSASRGHLCDSTAFLCFILHVHHSVRVQLGYFTVCWSGKTTPYGGRLTEVSTSTSWREFSRESTRLLASTRCSASLATSFFCEGNVLVGIRLDLGGVTDQGQIIMRLVRLKPRGPGSDRGPDCPVQVQRKFIK